MKTKLVGTSILISVFAIGLAQADKGGSTGVGGGGDVALLPGDKVVLADPFLDLAAHQPQGVDIRRELNPRLLVALRNSREAVAQHLKLLSVKPNSSQILARLQSLDRRDNGMRYHATRDTEQLRDTCSTSEPSPYSTPSGLRASEIICSQQSDIYLVESIFRKLNLREQALLLIYNRLQETDALLASRFTRGLGLFLDLIEEQRLRGHYRVLDSNEHAVMIAFYQSIDSMERKLANSVTDGPGFSQWSAARWGGGLIHQSARVHPAALVSLDFALGAQAVIERNAQLRSGQYGTTLLEQIQLGENAQIDRTRLSGSISVGRNSVISDSDLSGTITTGDQFEAKESRIHFPKASLLVGHRVQVTRSSIYVHDWTETGDPKGGPLATTLRLSEDQIIEDAILNRESVYMRYRAGTVYKPTDISILLPEGLVCNWYPNTETRRHLDLLDSATTELGAVPGAALSLSARTSTSLGLFGQDTFSLKKILFKFSVSTDSAPQGSPQRQLHTPEGAKSFLTVTSEGKAVPAGPYRFVQWGTDNGHKFRADRDMGNCVDRALLALTPLLRAKGFNVSVVDWTIPSYNRRSYYIEVPAQEPSL